MATPPPRARRDVPSAASVFGLVIVIAFGYLVGGVVLQAALGEVGLLLAEWIFLFCPAVAFVLAGRFDLRRTFSLRAPPPGATAAVLWLLAGTLPIIWLIGWLESFVFPVPEGLVKSLETLVTADGPGRLIWLLLLVAVTPAFCEEVVFRGVLLTGTRTLGPWRMIVVNGLVFGAFHLSFATPVRFLPTATLGIVIAWAVWRARSIWIGVLMHFANNALIVAVASRPRMHGAVADVSDSPSILLVLVAGVALPVGIRRLIRATSSSSDPMNTPKGNP